MNFVTSKEACNYFKINPTTLKVWKDNGKIKIKKGDYKIESIEGKEISYFYFDSVSSE